MNGYLESQRQIGYVQSSNREQGVHRNLAFTRLELLAVLGSISLLGLAARPLFANNDAASERAICFNNLRIIGRAVQASAGEDVYHRAPWWVPVAEGGTYQNPKTGVANHEFLCLSNQLIAPKVFACAGDSGFTVASNWVDFALNGVVSYTLGLHAGRGIDNDAWLSSDLNLRFDGANQICISGINNAAVFNAVSSAAWTNAVHGNNGHTLLYSGSVEFTSTLRLRQLVLASHNDGGSTFPDYGPGEHILRAR